MRLGQYFYVSELSFAHCSLATYFQNIAENVELIDTDDAFYTIVLKIAHNQILLI